MKIGGSKVVQVRIVDLEGWSVAVWESEGGGVVPVWLEQEVRDGGAGERFRRLCRLWARERGLALDSGARYLPRPTLAGDHVASRLGRVVIELARESRTMARVSLWRSGLFLIAVLY